jgi:hypothetical protein
MPTNAQNAWLIKLIGVVGGSGARITEQYGAGGGAPYAEDAKVQYPSGGGDVPTPPYRGGDGDVPIPPYRGGGDAPTRPYRGGGGDVPTPPYGGGGDVPTPPYRGGGGDVPTPPYGGGGGDVPTPPYRGGGGGGQYATGLDIIPGPMWTDCSPVHGKVPGPPEHLLCSKHGHIVDIKKKQIIAKDLYEYKSLYPWTPKPYGSGKPSYGGGKPSYGGGKPSYGGGETPYAGGSGTPPYSGGDYGGVGAPTPHSGGGAPHDDYGTQSSQQKEPQTPSEKVVEGAKEIISGLSDAVDGARKIVGGASSDSEGEA